MDMMRLRETLCKELEAIAQKGKMSAGDLETTHKLTDTIKNIDKIEKLEGGEYSQRGGDWSAGGTYNNSYGGYSGGYGGGNSQAGNSYANRRRDSMGRYSRSDGYGRMMYSRADGMEEMVEQIREMMENGDLSHGARNALAKAMAEMQK